MTEDAYRVAYEREKAARREAERLLEDLTSEIYRKNQALTEANQELKQNQQALIQQEKLASVGFLASGIAHEINNPLGYTVSNLAVLKDYVGELREAIDEVRKVAADNPALMALLDADSLVELLEDMPDLVAECQAGLATVRQIVADLRGFARTSEGATESVDINRCIETTLTVLRSELRKYCEVDLSLSELPPVTGNAGKLNQVLANLMLNAAQAMGEGGTLYVSSSVADKVVTIEIADDGPGVSEAHRAEIFSPFFTTKPVGEGTGLGLSIAYAIIHDEHDGELTLLDKGAGRGTGACFRITLPIAD